MRLDKLAYVREHIGSEELLKSFLENNKLVQKDKQALQWGYQELQKDRPNAMFVDDAYKVLAKIDSLKQTIDDDIKDTNPIQDQEKHADGDNTKINISFGDKPSRKSYLKYLVIGMVIIVLGYVSKGFFTGNTVLIEEVFKKDGLVYKKSTQELFTGVVEDYYRKGEQKLKANFINGKLDGSKTVWFINGQKEHESYFKNNQLNGTAYTWYKNGQKKYELYYKNDQLNGTAIAWYKNGQQRSEEEFKNNQLNGTAYTWYKNGQQRSEGEFINGKADGIAYTWYENGQKKTERHTKGNVYDGTVYHWYDNGNKAIERTFENGKLYGKAVMWHKNGQKLMELNAHNRRDIIFWDKNGIKIISDYERILAMAKANEIYDMFKYKVGDWDDSD